MSCIAPRRRFGVAFVGPIALALALTATPWSAVRAQVAQTRPQQPAAPGLVQLAPGIMWSATPLLVTDSIPGQHVEVRDLVLGPNQSAARVPLTGFVLMELRSGIAEVTTNGQTTRREAGAIWLVPSGAGLAIRNLAEVTVIRSTLISPR